MKKLSIVGGGIIGAMEAYFAFKEAQAKGEKTRITVYEAHQTLDQTTAMLIAPSLTPDEIACVVPRGRALRQKLAVPFNEPGGIRVIDVAGVAETESARTFIRAVEIDGANDEADAMRTQVLYKLGQFSMDEWSKIYDEADDELKEIMRASNFKPCREPREAGPKKLGDGYRIDLMSGMDDARGTAEGMKRDYASLGYAHSEILSPAETMRIDPALTDFCMSHSEPNAAGERVWKRDAVAIWRPGGCIDATRFLPKFYDYLKAKMGKDERGKDLFHLRMSRKVTGVLYEDEATLNGLSFPERGEKRNKQVYQDNQYVFCPGSAVGTLDRLGFVEPAYAGFAGASLKLAIRLETLPPALRAKYADLNHCMEVRREGVVLAWQAKVINGVISIAVAGTKAFYGETAPSKEEEFALDRNTLQLNMINEVFPELISLALQKDTRNQVLSRADLMALAAGGTALRAVGVRAVAYDNFPVLGQLYRCGERPVAVKNARTTTSLGSGGVSFAPGAVAASRAKAEAVTPLLAAVQKLADSRRKAEAEGALEVA